MNGNFTLNITTLVAVLITLVIGSIIAADLYSIVGDSIEQSESNGRAVNQTINDIRQLQNANDERGNETEQQLITILENQTKLMNEFNATNEAEIGKAVLRITESVNNNTELSKQSFEKIFKVLNITGEGN